jgi:integrase
VKKFALGVWRCAPNRLICSGCVDTSNSCSQASARNPKRLPVVLSKAEVRAVLAHLDGTHWLIANLPHGSGLRLMEAHRLRVKDVVMDRGELIVRDAKGGRDRLTAAAGGHHRSASRTSCEAVRSI